MHDHKGIQNKEIARGVKHVTMIVRHSQVTTNVLLAFMPTEPKTFA